MSLRAIPLYQELDYVKPFRENAVGFNSHWWSQRPKRIADETHEFVTFELDSEEVARAEVDPCATLSDDYTGQGHQPAGEIVRIEVRADRHCGGIGKDAISLIARRYPSILLFALPVRGAEGFWDLIGWIRLVHQDGDAAASAFVRPPR